MPEKVKKLTYQIIIDRSDGYSSAPDFKEDTPEFEMIVKNETITFIFKSDISDKKAAKEIADDYLKRWSVLIGIEHEPDELRFEYDSCEMETTSERSCGTVIEIFRNASNYMNFLVFTKKKQSSFPTIPKSFKLDHTTESMYNRYYEFKMGGELLTSMAYLCITTIIEEFGNLQSVAENLKISKRVLKKLKTISSTRGTASEVRKMSNQHDDRPLTEGEKKFMEEVVKILIRRSGEYAFDKAATFAKITMADLPSV